VQLVSNGASQTMKDCESQQARGLLESQQSSSKPNHVLLQTPLLTQTSTEDSAMYARNGIPDPCLVALV